MHNGNTWESPGIPGTIYPYEPYTRAQGWYARDADYRMYTSSVCTRKGPKYPFLGSKHPRFSIHFRGGKDLVLNPDPEIGIKKGPKRAILPSEGLVVI